MTTLSFGIMRGTEIVFRDENERGRLGVSLLRTLRLPDDGVRYPLPPGMGPLPLRRVSELAGRVPAQWLTRPGVVVPMYRCEAIWLLFSADHPLPHAVKVGCGGINALTGRPLSRQLERPARPGLWRRMLGAAAAQDYAVCPPQQFIDGFNTGHHSVRQFVAVPLGEGRTVEGQVTGHERHGGIQLCVYPPRRELEPALASAGRLALPGLQPVTAGRSAIETETHDWEWNGPGAATPVMPVTPDGETMPLMPGDAMTPVMPGGDPTPVTPGGDATPVMPGGDPTPVMRLGLADSAGSPDSAHETTVDLVAPARPEPMMLDDAQDTLRGYFASPEPGLESGALGVPRGAGASAPAAPGASALRSAQPPMPDERSDPAPRLRGGHVPRGSGHDPADDRVPHVSPQPTPPRANSAQPAPFAGSIRGVDEKLVPRSSTPVREAPSPIAARGAPSPMPTRGAPSPMPAREAPSPIAAREAPLPMLARGAPPPMLTREAPSPAAPAPGPAMKPAAPQTASPGSAMPPPADSAPGPALTATLSAPAIELGRPGSWAPGAAAPAPPGSAYAPAPAPAPQSSPYAPAPGSAYAPKLAPPGSAYAPAPPGSPYGPTAAPQSNAAPVPPGSAYAPARSPAPQGPGYAPAPARLGSSVPVQPGSAYAPGAAFSGAPPQPVAPAAAATTLAGSATVLGARRPVSASARVQPVADRALGLGAGGQISQRIYTDVYGIETWDEAACAELYIHIVSPQAWYAMTGEPPPPTPVTFHAYQAAGLPWFQTYDEDLAGIAPAPGLAQIRSVDDFDRRR